jgi:hypothetical protein
MDHGNDLRRMEMKLNQIIAGIKELKQKKDPIDVYRQTQESLAGRKRAFEAYQKNDEPTTHSGTLIHQVPLEIDWTPAAIKTEASFILQDNGKMTVVFEVVGEDADILKESLTELPVETLQLAAY